MTIPHSNQPDDLAQRVLGRIDNERLTPRPRWEFILKNYVLWGLGITAVVLASLAFSATLFEVVNTDWSLSPATHPSTFTFFLETAPFFWVIALALFTLVGYLYVRRTKHGYRYPLATILTCAVLISVASGAGLYAVGFGGIVEESLGDRVPLYRPILAQQREWWAAPERGLLGGEVATITPRHASSSVVILRDLSGREWSVDTSDLSERDMAMFSQGAPVRVVGAPATSSDARFHACFVFSRGGKANGRVEGRQGRKGGREKSDLCKAIRPYIQLRALKAREESGD